MQFLRPALLSLALASTTVMAASVQPLKTENTKYLAKDRLTAGVGGSITGQFPPFGRFGAGCGVNANVSIGLLGGGFNVGDTHDKYSLAGGYTMYEHNATIGVGAKFKDIVTGTEVKLQAKKAVFELSSNGRIECAAPHIEFNHTNVVVCTATVA